MPVAPVVGRINALLAVKGISKSQFYQDCNISSAAYSLWNTGKTSPTPKNIKRIADYLQTTPEYLTGETAEAERPPIPQEVQRIARGGKDLSPEEWDRAYDILKLAFPGKFGNE